jgi:hypothetical protein
MSDVIGAPAPDVDGELTRQAAAAASRNNWSDTEALRFTRGIGWNEAIDERGVRYSDAV